MQQIVKYGYYINDIYPQSQTLVILEVICMSLYLSPFVFMLGLDIPSHVMYCSDVSLTTCAILADHLCAIIGNIDF